VTVVEMAGLTLVVLLALLISFILGWTIVHECAEEGAYEPRHRGDS
jgi:hypothetical protein